MDRLYHKNPAGDRRKASAQRFQILVRKRLD